MLVDNMLSQQPTMHQPAPTSTELRKAGSNVSELLAN